MRGKAYLSCAACVEPRWMISAVKTVFSASRASSSTPSIVSTMRSQIAGRRLSTLVSSSGGVHRQRFELSQPMMDKSGTRRPTACAYFIAPTASTSSLASTASNCKPSRSSSSSSRARRECWRILPRRSGASASRPPANYAPPAHPGTSGELALPGSCCWSGTGTTRACIRCPAAGS